jgi:quercetin 2,3-dioxygenase
VADLIEITKSRTADVAGTLVRRALPLRTRRTVGAWCFADHMGPVPVTEDAGMDVGPHPHMGLQTVTWLVSGELLHRDSLGSEQLIRPGQLNLMTAGQGVSHAEESTGRYRGELQGIQLWVAQPEATRHGPPAFEHHTDLPQLAIGDAIATVLVGKLAENPASASSARRDTDHVGLDVQLRPGRTLLPLVTGHEYAIVVLGGAVTVTPSRTRIVPGELGYLGLGRGELELSAAEETRFLLLGGEPFESPILMWWNFVGRTREEMITAATDWNAPDATGARFGDPGSALARIPAPNTPWA